MWGRLPACMLSLTCTLILAVYFAGCDDPVAPEDTAVTLQIQTELPTILAPIETVQLLAAALDGTGQIVPGLVISWNSSATAVATVDPVTSILTAVSEGMSTVTASVGSVTATILVTVTERSTSYNVVFQSTWSAETHPTDFPTSPHFSGLIGGTHDSDVTFWAEAALASLGIRNMAETGSKGPLSTEVEVAIGAGTAAALLSGGGINPSPAAVELAFDITVEHSLVTLVSMIAPSPDWFVGVHDLVLLEEGVWVEEVVVQLLPYDAGTDSGLTFTSANEATDPPVAVARLQVSPFDASTPLGTFTFTRTADE